MIDARQSWVPLRSSPSRRPTGLITTSNDDDSTPTVACRVNVSKISDVDIISHTFIAKFQLDLRMPVSLYNVLDTAGEVRYDRLYAFSNLAEIIGEMDKRVEKAGDEVILHIVACGKFLQYFRMHDFPHDEHLLSIRLTSNIPCVIPASKSGDETAIRLRLVGDTNKPNVMRAHQYFMARDTWKLRQDIYTDRWLSNPSDSGSGKQYPHFYWSFELSRHPAFFHWNVSLPVFTLTSLSFVGYFLDEISDRVAVNLTLLLTSVAYKLVVANSLPQLSYLTLLDKYTLFSSLIICAVFMADTVIPAHGDLVGGLVAICWCCVSLTYTAICVMLTRPSA